MAIQCKFDTRPLSRSDFYEVDHLVMRHAFAIQNELGRLYDECVYQKELVRRCTGSGLAVLSEGEIVVSSGSFRKSFYLDVLINRGSIYELKAVDSLTGRHESQVLNYLLLSRLVFGKLINFSSPSVQYRFVTSGLTDENRRAFEVDETAWLQEAPMSGTIREIVRNLLEDWGACLDVHLYREAICHFLGGEEALMHSADVSIGGCVVGTQAVCLLDGETGLHVSSIIRHSGSYKKQLMKMLEHTGLTQMQWVNFDRMTVHLTTLKK